MNPLRLYIKNRLEKLEKENEDLKSRLFFADRTRKIGYCFQRIIKEADIQIEYLNDFKRYHIYSGKTGHTIYTFDANDEWDTAFISYLLEIIPVRRE